MQINLTRQTFWILAFVVFVCQSVWQHDNYSTRIAYLEGQVSEWNEWFNSEDLGHADQSITVRPDMSYNLIQNSTRPAPEIPAPEDIPFGTEVYDAEVAALTTAMQQLGLAPELLALANAEQSAHLAGIRDELRTMIRVLVMLAYEENKDRDALQRTLRRIEGRLPK